LLGFCLKKAVFANFVLSKLLFKLFASTLGMTLSSAEMTIFIPELFSVELEAFSFVVLDALTKPTKNLLPFISNDLSFPMLFHLLLIIHNKITLLVQVKLNFKFSLKLSQFT